MAENRSVPGRALSPGRDAGILGDVPAGLYDVSEINPLANGEVWLATGQGLIRWKEGRFTAIEATKGQNLWSVEKCNNTLWYAGKQGVYKLHNNTPELMAHADELPIHTDMEYTMKCLPNGRLAVYGTGGLALIDSADSLISSEFTTLATGHPLQILYLIEQPGGTLLAGATDRFYNIIPNNEQLTFEPYPMDYGTFYSGAVPFVFSAKYSGYKPVWDGSELLITKRRVVLDGEVVFTISNPDAQIINTAHDPEGGLWMTIDMDGLYHLTLSKFSIFKSTVPGHDSNAYSTVFDKENRLWVGYGNSGIITYGDTLTPWAGVEDAGNLPYPMPLYTRSLYLAPEGSMYANFWNSYLFRYHPVEQWNWYHVGPPQITIKSYYTAPNGTFWIGTRQGLFRRADGQETFQPVQLEDSEIHNVQVISDMGEGHLIMASATEGLFEWSQKSGLSRIKSDSIITTNITDLHQTGKNELWAASATQGLLYLRFRRDSLLNITHSGQISRKDGLPHDGIYRILEDEYGYFWLTTKSGLVRVKRSELEKKIAESNSNYELYVEVFTEAHGLPIREFNEGTQAAGTIDHNGYAWLPTQKGVVSFNPADFKNYEKQRFAHTKLFVKSVQTTDTLFPAEALPRLELKSKHRELDFQMGILHFNNPDDLTIEYRIPSLDTTWQALPEERRLSLAAIPAGSYQMQLKFEGVPANIFPLSRFDFVIPAYFYETPWFILLCIFMSFSAVALLFYRQQIRAEHREKQLHAKVRERTKMVRQEKAKTEASLKKIKEQAKELEYLGSAKVQFFMNIAHELRTPLSLIQGPLELLLDTDYSDKKDLDTKLKTIERNSKKLNQLVDRTLEYMRAQSGEELLHLQPLDFKALLQVSLSLFEEHLQQKRKKLILRLDDDRPVWVLADRYALELMINNLLSNAVRYTEPGDTITIKLFVDEEKDQSVLTVHDTGQGIKEDLLPHIFEPFYKNNSSNGFGIGLALVSQYAEQMNGTITVESDDGVYTRFTLRLPTTEQELLDLQPDELNHHLQNKESSNQTTGEEPKPTQKTILVIEDNAEFRQFITSILGEIYHLEMAANENEALDMLKKIRPDLVICDVMLDTIGGIELVKIIRKQNTLKNLPVVFLSAHHTSTMIRKGLEAGANAYLTKPVSPKVLAAQIKVLIRGTERANRSREKIAGGSDTKSNSFMQTINSLIERHIADQHLTIDHLAENMHTSTSTLYRKWKKYSQTEISLKKYILRQKLTRAIEQAREDELTLEQVSDIFGFLSPANFSQAYKREF